MVSDLGKKMLIIVAKRGYTGASREVFFHHIHGIRYAALEREVLTLEKNGMITIEWVGPSNFTVFITKKGVEVATTFQKGIWHKSTEALEKLQKTKPKEASITTKKVGYEKIIDKKIGVEEVGAISEEITKKMDEHIRAERASSSEEAEPSLPQSIGVPAVQEEKEEVKLGEEKDVVEKRISGEIEGIEIEKGEKLTTEDMVKEDTSEARIATEEGIDYIQTVKEKRISGEMEGITPPSGATRVGVKAKESASFVSEQEAIPPPSPEDVEEIEAPPAPEDTGEPDLPFIPEDVDKGEPSPGFSYQKELTSLFDEPAPPPAETKPVLIFTEGHCVWEPDIECTVLKSSDFGPDTTLTINHCMVCQLVKVKHLLEKK